MEMVLDSEILRNIISDYALLRGVAVDMIQFQAVRLAMATGDLDSKVQALKGVKLRNCWGMQSSLLIAILVWLIELLRDEELAEHAVWALIQPAQDASACKFLVPQVIGILSSTEAPKCARLKAFELISQMNDHYVALTIPAVIGAFKDLDAEVRASAASVFAAILARRLQQPHADLLNAMEVAVPGLKELCADPNLDVRFEAAQSLSYIGEEKVLVIHTLSQMLAMDNGKYWIPAMECLRVYGADLHQIVPRLIEIVDGVGYASEYVSGFHERDQVKFGGGFYEMEEAVLLLGLIGRKAASAIPALERVLTDPTWGPGFHLEVEHALSLIRKGPSILA